MNKILSIYFSKRFYKLLSIIAVLFVFGHFVHFVFICAKLLLAIFSALFMLELLIHLIRGDISGGREAAIRFSNGDRNPVKLTIGNLYPTPVRLSILDDLPKQFQARDFKINCQLKSGQEHQETYYLRPVERGVYKFGNLNVIVSIISGLCEFRYRLAQPQDVAVYPSFFQLKKLELLSFANERNPQGVKKIRRLGNNREFEQIKEYVTGDDYRLINWKATARKSKLMVNEYQDERSQNVYQLIDMGRCMKMPFEGMSLLDYAINSTLAISNVILKKHDRAGILTYSDKVHTLIKAENRRNQLNHILESLYSQETLFIESNLEKPYIQISRNTTGRSLIILYTNFESVLGLERQLKILKQMARQHLVLLVSFINSEVANLANKNSESTEDIYLKAVAERNILEKELFMEQLSHYGIMNLRVKPEELTISVLNKYLVNHK